MHKLIKKMGLEIVCEKDEEPGNQSRLTIPKDISHVLQTTSVCENTFDFFFYKYKILISFGKWKEPSNK